MTMEGYYRQIDLLYMALERAQKHQDRDLVVIIGKRINELQAQAPFNRSGQEP